MHLLVTPPRSGQRQNAPGRARQFQAPGRKRRLGTSAVEFALVAPLFLFMVLGLVEIARAMMVKQVLTNAAREGARIGVLDGTTTSQITSAVTRYAESASLKGVTIVVTPDPPSSAAYGSPVTVTVSVPYNQVSWSSAPWFLGGQTLKAACSMRREIAQ